MGVLSFVIVASVDIVGLPGAVVSIVNATALDEFDTLFAASVAVTVNEYDPSASSDYGVTEKLPLPSVVAVPIDDPLLIRLIVLFISAVPLIVGLVSFVAVVPVDIVGCAGFVVSIVNETEFSSEDNVSDPSNSDSANESDATDAVDVFPAVSVAVTVKS